jgi:hypothetical protein
MSSEGKAGGGALQDLTAEEKAELFDGDGDMAFDDDAHDDSSNSTAVVGVGRRSSTAAVPAGIEADWAQLREGLQLMMDNR